MTGGNDPKEQPEPTRPRWQTNLGILAGLATLSATITGIAINLGRTSVPAVLAITGAVTAAGELFRRYGERNKNDEE
jgi:hypothetical protein